MSIITITAPNISGNNVNKINFTNNKYTTTIDNNIYDDIDYNAVIVSDTSNTATNEPTVADLVAEAKTLQQQNVQQQQDFIGPQPLQQDFIGPQQFPGLQNPVYGPPTLQSYINNQNVINPVDKFENVESSDGVKAVAGITTKTVNKGITIGKNSIIERNLLSNPFSNADQYDYVNSHAFVTEFGNDGDEISDIVNGLDTQKELYKYYYNMYNDTTLNIHSLESSREALIKEMDAAIGKAAGNQEQISSIYQTYEGKIQKIDDEILAKKAKIAGPGGDPSKVQTEKVFLGNTQSQLVSYGTQSLWTAGASFVLSEGSEYAIAYANAKRANLTDEEAREYAAKAVKDNAAKAGVQAVSLGTGTFAGNVLSHGNTSWASSTGTVFTNFATFGYDYFTADSPEAKQQVLDSELAPTIAGSTGALATAPVPYLSGNTGNILG